MQQITMRGVNLNQIDAQFGSAFRGIGKLGADLV